MGKCFSYSLFVLFLATATAHSRSWLDYDSHRFDVSQNAATILLSKTQVNQKSSWFSHSVTYDNGPTMLYALQYNLQNKGMPNSDKAEPVLRYQGQSILSVFQFENTLVSGQSTQAPILFRNLNSDGSAVRAQWPAFTGTTAINLPGYTFLSPSRNNQHFLHGAKIFATDSQEVAVDLSAEVSFSDFLALPHTPAQSQYRLSKDLHYIAYLSGILLPGSEGEDVLAQVYDVRARRHFPVRMRLAGFDVRAEVLDMGMQGDELQFLVKYTSKALPDKKGNRSTEHWLDRRYSYQLLSYPSGQVADLPLPVEISLYASGKDFFWDVAAKQLYWLDLRSAAQGEIQLSVMALEAGTIQHSVLKLPALRYNAGL